MKKNTAHKLPLLLFITSIFITINCQAEESTPLFSPNYAFFNTSINYLDWTSGSLERINHSRADFSYIDFRGGANFNWGDIFFFIDIENPTKGWNSQTPDNLRIVAKPIFDIKLFNSPWALHIQNYWLKEKDFYVSNLVVGLSYKYTQGNFWIRPFIGPHYQEQTYYDGMNGYMAGYVFSYKFKLATYNFKLTQWHEYEFDRDTRHYQKDDGSINPFGDGASHGVNGALALWWNINKVLSVGYQYRYVNNKLGSGGRYLNGNIFSLAYHF